MAESAFWEVVVYGLSVLACSHLTLTRRTIVVCEGFVRTEGHVYVTTDKVWEQQLLSDSSAHCIPWAWSDTLWKEYRCSCYFSDGFCNRWYRRPGFKCAVKWLRFVVFKVDCKFNNCVLYVLRLTTLTAWFLYGAGSACWIVAWCFLRCHARPWIS